MFFFLFFILTIWEAASLATFQLLESKPQGSGPGTLNERGYALPLHYAVSRLQYFMTFQTSHSTIRLSCFQVGPTDQAVPYIGTAWLFLKITHADICNYVYVYRQINKERKMKDSSPFVPYNQISTIHSTHNSHLASTFLQLQIPAISSNIPTATINWVQQCLIYLTFRMFQPSLTPPSCHSDSIRPPNFESF